MSAPPTSEPHSERYLAYLASREWRAMRVRVVAETGDWCKRCGVKGPSLLPGARTLDVHHLTYARLGREETDDLMLLCRGCHDAIETKHFTEHLWLASDDGGSRVCIDLDELEEATW